MIRTRSCSNASISTASARGSALRTFSSRFFCPRGASAIFFSRMMLVRSFAERACATTRPKNVIPSAELLSSIELRTRWTRHGLRAVRVRVADSAADDRRGSTRVATRSASFQKKDDLDQNLTLILMVTSDFAHSVGVIPYLAVAAICGMEGRLALAQRRNNRYIT